MLWEETDALKVVSSKPSTIYWMNIFSHLFVGIFFNVCLKWTEKNEKEDGDGALLGVWVVEWVEGLPRIQRREIRCHHAPM